MIDAEKVIHPQGEFIPAQFLGNTADGFLGTSFRGYPAGCQVGVIITGQGKEKVTLADISLVNEQVWMSAVAGYYGIDLISGFNFLCQFVI